MGNGERERERERCFEIAVLLNKNLGKNFKDI
jgi:hypothetical protein